MGKVTLGGARSGQSQGAHQKMALPTKNDFVDDMH